METFRLGQIGRCSLPVRLQDRNHLVRLLLLRQVDAQNHEEHPVFLSWSLLVEPQQGKGPPGKKLAQTLENKREERENTSKREDVSVSSK
jgi:hypothetical protein